MPPRLGSRHTFCRGVLDQDGRRFLSEREPFEFREFNDSIWHTVQQGDSWWNLAARYYRGMPRASGYWWAIADFQPSRVVDPTLELEVGTRVVVPSLRVLTDVILSPRRRQEHG